MIEAVMLWSIGLKVLGLVLECSRLIAEPHELLKSAALKSEIRDPSTLSFPSLKPDHTIATSCLGDSHASRAASSILKETTGGAFRVYRASIRLL